MGVGGWCGCACCVGGGVWRRLLPFLLLLLLLVVLPLPPSLPSSPISPPHTSSTSTSPLLSIFLHPLTSPIYFFPFLSSLSLFLAFSLTPLSLSLLPAARRSIHPHPRPTHFIHLPHVLPSSFLLKRPSLPPPLPSFTLGSTPSFSAFLTTCLCSPFLSLSMFIFGLSLSLPTVYPSLASARPSISSACFNLSLLGT